MSNEQESFARKYFFSIAFVLALLLPLSDLILSKELRFADALRPIFIFAILGLGLNVVTGFTGLLNFGVAGFMAIGAYVQAILTCDIYPFQLGFWLGLLCSIICGAAVGFVLGLPTLRLRGDYLAIVTLGFGEIIQDCLRNLDVITKGSQGINPLPAPTLFGWEFTPGNYLPWYFLFLFLLLLVVKLNLNLEHSRLGRALLAIREDELAAACAGIETVRVKLFAFAFGAGLCSMAGALWASYLGSTGEPGNFDFQVSVLALCIVIVGGLGSIKGVLLGSFVMIGFNSILLEKLSKFLAQQGLVSTGNVFTSPSNWKYLIFGFALILMMRLKPQGLLPAKSSGAAADAALEQGAA